jgi:ADP-heptose:LPS heptosyltransferase
MIVALRALGLGDLLTAVPALRALRRARPDDELVLAAPRALGPLLMMGALADRFVPVEPAIAHPPASMDSPGGHVALAVNLHGKGPQSTEVLRRLSPAALWSYGVPGGPEWDPDEHEVDRWCRLVAHYGCRPDRGDLSLRPRTRPGVGVLVHPGAATADRRWPPERYAAVAAQIADAGHRVRITAGPGERDLAGEVAGRAGRRAVEVSAGSGLAELADIVQASALIICGDTGVAHLATALGTPSVVIFGPQPPSRWGPPALPRHQVLWHPMTGTAPTDQPHPSLFEISVADVVAAATTALAETA